MLVVVLPRLATIDDLEDETVQASKGTCLDKRGLIWGSAG